MKEKQCWANEASNYKLSSRCSLNGRYYKSVEQSENCAFWPGWVAELRNLGLAPSYSPGPRGGPGPSLGKTESKSGAIVVQTEAERHDRQASFLPCSYLRVQKAIGACLGCR